MRLTRTLVLRGEDSGGTLLSVLVQGGPGEGLLLDAGVEQAWEQAPSGYTLTVTDPETTAPQVARALVAAGADILSLGEWRHSPRERTSTSNWSTRT